MASKTVLDEFKVDAETLVLEIRLDEELHRRAVLVQLHVGNADELGVPNEGRSEGVDIYRVIVWIFTNVRDLEFPATSIACCTVQPHRAPCRVRAKLYNSAHGLHMRTIKIFYKTRSQKGAKSC